MITYCSLCGEIRDGFFCVAHGVPLTTPKTYKERVEAIGIILNVVSRCFGRNGNQLETQHPVTLWALSEIEKIVRGRPDVLSKHIAASLRSDGCQITAGWPKSIQEFIGNDSFSPEC